MRILTLCYEYPPIGGGGGRVAQAVAEGLVERGHEVRVQTAALGVRSTHETSRGVAIRRTATGRRRADTCAVYEMGLYVAASLLPVLVQCRDWQPQVLHAHFAMPTGLLAYAVHRLTGIPYVLTAHLGDVPGGVPEQTDRLFRWIAPLARRVWSSAAAATAVSGFVQELAEQSYHRPVSRIVNGIDLAGRPPIESLAIGPPRRLLFLGRFNPQKNAPLLIDALAQLDSPAWQLTMIGAGPDLPEVRARIERHGLQSRVHLAGWQSSAEVARALAQSDILCLPSSSEGMPVAAVEALKFGLAIAASDIPGVRDVVSPGENGLTAPAGDACAYTNVLRAMMRPDPLLAMRRASWRKAEQFTLKGSVGEYERVLSTASR